MVHAIVCVAFCNSVLKLLGESHPKGLAAWDGSVMQRS